MKGGYNCAPGFHEIVGTRGGRLTDQRVRRRWNVERQVRVEGVAG